jgi:hypothetical protein
MNGKRRTKQEVRKNKNANQVERRTALVDELLQFIQ